MDYSCLGKEAGWERVLMTFQKYAIDFKKRYGCVPVLILDNCDALAKKDQKMLETLQDTAKTAIDDSTWVTIFIGSVGEAPEQMEGLLFSFKTSNIIYSHFQVEVVLLELHHLSKY
jgi:chromosomal replication initiation ATPase DnaA